MGYNISRLPTPYHAVYHRKSRFGQGPLEDLLVQVWQERVSRSMLLADLPNLEFVKPEHWRRAASAPDLSVFVPQSGLATSQPSA
jgi:hypothetical protein